MPSTSGTLPAGSLLASTGKSRQPEKVQQTHTTSIFFTSWPLTPVLQPPPHSIAALATLKPHGPGYFPETLPEGVDHVGEPMEEGRTESLEEIIAKVREGGAVSWRGVTWVWNALRPPS